MKVLIPAAGKSLFLKIIFSLNYSLTLAASP